VVRGSCAGNCPSPCVCATLFDPQIPGFVPYEICAMPCKIPGSCSGEDRCSYLDAVKTSKHSVCLPGNISTPSAKQSVNVDCFSSEYVSRLRCRNGDLVQYQPFYILGGIQGSLCAYVVLENCSGGCSFYDSGVPNCIAKYDGGVNTYDSGTPICCPHYWIGGCRPTSGPKRPPHGCRLTCCDRCSWKMDVKNDCRVWRPVTLDMGVDK
jgi:hypothetical protein